eukprot:TRINITY_DN12483_c0_g5_i1.p1 TRINITY_DN12483_c0_g5~~TRINITY_DN12483_c0_g5_i1.p1  ORF type:complete len:224 (-),score=65.19 TRINITY_DN12483_c0_g5_i1:533-1204(-)
MLLYKKLGCTCKELQQHRTALLYFKKQLQLAWYCFQGDSRSEEDAVNELDAYDSIGMQYYYLKNIDKARYYHNRMMNNELERNSSAKLNSLQLLKETRKANAFKRSFITKTIFEKYRDKDADFKHLHSNIEEVKVLDVKLKRMTEKPLLESPRYEGSDLRDRVLKKALKRILQDPSEDAEALRRADAKLWEGGEKSHSVENQSSSEEQKKLFSNLRVAVLAGQ